MKSIVGTWDIGLSRPMAFKILETNQVTGWSNDVEFALFL